MDTLDERVAHGSRPSGARCGHGLAEAQTALEARRAETGRRVQTFYRVKRAASRASSSMRRTFELRLPGAVPAPGDPRRRGRRQANAATLEARKQAPASLEADAAALAAVQADLRTRIEVP